MPILVSALLSLGIAWARGASPLQLGAIRLRWLLLPPAAYVTQFLAFTCFGETTAPYALWIQLGSVGLLLAFLLANHRYRSLLIVAAGTTLNLLVIASNGGYMPVRITDVARAGFPDMAAHLAAEGHFQKSMPLDEHTHAPWLADILYIPLPGPDRILSVGDVLVGAGTFLFVQEALLGGIRQRTVSDEPSATDHQPRTTE